MPDQIVLEGIEVPAALGVSKPERRMRRPVRIDLRCEVDLARAGQTDRIAHTIDYSEIFRAVREVAEQQEHRLVEALAERIAARLLASFPLEVCTVCVRKPTPVAGNLRAAGVRITRRKNP